jgi:hypothetical protein
MSTKRVVTRLMAEASFREGAADIILELIAYINVNLRRGSYLVVEQKDGWWRVRAPAQLLQSAQIASDVWNVGHG